MKCFIVGNGPSLAKTNLDLITGQPSYACNNIHLIYGTTNWRPTHYVRAEDRAFVADGDHSGWITSVQTHLYMGIPCYMSGFYKDTAKGYSNYHELKHCHEQVYDYDDPDAPDEWHLPMICQFGGSLIVAMQLAIKEGYDELILIGCDLGYKNNKPSHFDPRYEHGKEGTAFYANRNNLWAHLCGINYHGRRGIPYNVINATIGGDLHLYPRQPLEELV